MVPFFVSIEEVTMRHHLFDLGGDSKIDVCNSLYGLIGLLLNLGPERSERNHSQFFRLLQEKRQFLCL